MSRPKGSKNRKTKPKGRPAGKTLPEGLVEYISSNILLFLDQQKSFSISGAAIEKLEAKIQGIVLRALTIHKVF